MWGTGVGGVGGGLPHRGGDKNEQGRPWLTMEEEEKSRGMTQKSAREMTRHREWKLL